MTGKFSLSEATLGRIEALRAHFPPDARRSLILPALHLVQEERGYVPPEAMPYLASLLRIPEIWVKEAFSWYGMFDKEKGGKYRILVCANLSCCLRGGMEIVEYLKQKLGVGLGETTSDGKFTLNTTTECLASCGTAPMMMINDRFYEELTQQKIDQILAELK